MRCPLCNSRPAKRQCPALGQTICAVCCATKRLVEIRCPSDCGYLASSRQHPAAVTRRQHEQDVLMLTPALAELTDRQSRFFFLFQSIVARQPSDPLRPLVDSDAVDAASSLARSLESASRGVIYEQLPQSLPAQDLASAFRKAYEEVAAQLQGPRTPLERDAAKAFDALAEAARKVGPLAGDSRSGFIELARRVLKPSGEAAANAAREDRGPGSIIVP
jgi:hypothetical protein